VCISYIPHNHIVMQQYRRTEQNHSSKSLETVMVSFYTCKEEKIDFRQLFKSASYKHGKVAVYSCWIVSTTVTLTRNTYWCKTCFPFSLRRYSQYLH